MLREAIRSSGVDVFVDCAEVIVHTNPQLVSGALSLGPCSVTLLTVQELSMPLANLECSPDMGI